LKQLFSCLNHILLRFKGDIIAERVINFMVLFATNPPKGREGECNVFTETLLEYLLELCPAADKGVRYRCCQLVAGIFNNLPVDAEVTEELAERLQWAMLQRAKDKVPQVRVQAIRALSRLADPGEDGLFLGDPVTDAMLQALESDKNKDVRKSVIAAISLCPRTLEAVIERTKDVNEEVRRAVFLVIGEKIPLSELSAANRARLITNGLKDRHSAVARSASSMVATWLTRDCGGNVLELLRMVGVTDNEDVAVEAIHSLIASEHIRPVAASKDQGLLREDGSFQDNFSNNRVLSPEAALYWRVLCQWLNSGASEAGTAAALTDGAAAEAKAAVAGECLEALDRLLPSPAETLLSYAALHAASVENRFATKQLLAVASQCMDFADGGSRSAATALLRGLLLCSDGPPSGDAGWWEAVEALLHESTPGVEEEVHLVREILQEVQQKAEQPEGSSGAPDWCWHCALRPISMMLRRFPAAGEDDGETPQDICRAVEEAIQTWAAPALQHASEDVRVRGVEALGLYCLVGKRLSVSPALRSSLLLALSEGSPRVQNTAARALCDLLLIQGSESRLLPASDERGTCNVVEHLIGLLEDALRCPALGSSEVCSSVAEGVAKLLVQRSHAASGSALREDDVDRALRGLLLLHFSPTTQRQALMRQCLAVMFDAYPRLHPANFEALCRAFLPTAHQAVVMHCSSKRRVAARPVDFAVLRFVTQLFCIPLKGGESSHHGACQALLQLAEEAMKEVLSLPPSRLSKAYASALCKAVAAMPITQSGPMEVRRLQYLSELVAKSPLLDKPAAKDVASLLESIERMGCCGQGQMLANSEMDELDRELASYSLEEDLMDVLQEKATRRSQRGAESESSYSTHALSSPGERRTLPTRRARTAPKAAVEESSSDSGEEQWEEPDISDSERKSEA